MQRMSEEIGEYLLTKEHGKSRYLWDGRIYLIPRASESYQIVFREGANQQRPINWKRSAPAPEKPEVQSLPASSS